MAAEVLVEVVMVEVERVVGAMEAVAMEMVIREGSLVEVAAMWVD